MGVDAVILVKIKGKNNANGLIIEDRQKIKFDKQIYLDIIISLLYAAYLW